MRENERNEKVKNRTSWQKRDINRGDSRKKYLNKRSTHNFRAGTLWQPACAFLQRLQGVPGPNLP